MASKRHKRRRSCESKKRHVTKEDAHKHAKQLGPGYLVYACTFCGGWHVGRKAHQRVHNPTVLTKTIRKRF